MESITREQVQELIFRRRQEIGELSDKAQRYQDACDEKARRIHEEIALLERIAKILLPKEEIMGLAPVKFSTPYPRTTTDHIKGNE